MKFILLVALIGYSFISSAEVLYLKDSVGVEKSNGKTLILHKVENSETLYSLSRRYNVSIYNIIKQNPPVEFGLEVGQIVKIPYEKTQPKPVASKPKGNTTAPAATTKTESPVLVNNDPGKKTGQIIHVVKPKETVYSISRQYGVSIADLKSWNNLEGNILDIGQELIIKQAAPNEERERLVTQPSSKEVEENIHVVQAGETLYSLSRQYDVSLQDLSDWNDLKDNTISVGQRLIVGKISARAVTQDVVEQSPNLVIADQVVVDEPVTTTTNEFPSGNRKKDSTDVNTSTSERDHIFKKEVLESGNAQLIEGSENTRKYLALHRTAKIGTIMKVRNEMNGQEVFVRVMGKLPDTGVNEHVLIKISKSAYDRLGAIDPKFRVSVSYIPQ
ncbi:LysM peptidoglycan-binding domain-containing protein [Fulvivirga sediminis]|uniref:LysM peptidoglycan-binding domain-containing protein n=1 Tax=Fulvivirga sediminis TaxID=2803949 RepID=A0A937F718_9BACT|nr:LysM peptidoglycan-binding domain-containing protein [Fulvivirga sediminis]MBL3656212.1 LysM peptidoglycan-binding domain-containing protein [Fulvivirga sediminis]